MADLKTKSTSAQGREVILTKGAGTAIEDGDGVAFIGAIVNDLTTGGATAPLSAEQGVEAKTLIDGKVAKAGDTMTGLLRNASGINFNAAGGITLSDYEVGTWTPEFDSHNGSFGSVTYASQVGRYVKIGNMCAVFGQVHTSSITVGTASSFMYVKGLPYTSLNLNDFNQGFGLYGTSWDTNAPGTGLVVPNANRLRLSYRSGGNSAVVVVSDLNTGSTGNFVRLALIYRIED